MQRISLLEVSQPWMSKSVNIKIPRVLQRISMLTTLTMYLTIASINLSKLQSSASMVSKSKYQLSRIRMRRLNPRKLGSSVSSFKIIKWGIVESDVSRAQPLAKLTTWMIYTPLGQYKSPLRYLLIILKITLLWKKVFIHRLMSKINLSLS